MRVFTILMAMVALSSLSTAEERPVPMHGPALVEITVKGMFCEMCPITIRKALEQLDQVAKAEVSREQELARVWVHASRMQDIQQLVRTINRLGYMAYVRAVHRGSESPATVGER